MAPVTTFPPPFLGTPGMLQEVLFRSAECNWWSYPLLTCSPSTVLESSQLPQCYQTFFPCSSDLEKNNPPQKPKCMCTKTELQLFSLPLLHLWTGGLIQSLLLALHSLISFLRGLPGLPNCLDRYFRPTQQSRHILTCSGALNSGLVVRPCSSLGQKGRTYAIPVWVSSPFCVCWESNLGAEGYDIGVQGTTSSQNHLEAAAALEQFEFETALALSKTADEEARAAASSEDTAIARAKRLSLQPVCCGGKAEALSYKLWDTDRCE